MRESYESALVQAARALWVAVVVAVGGPALVASFADPRPAAAYAQWREVEATSRPVSDAEAADVADRLRRQFRATTDFGPLMGRYFVGDVGRRNMRDGSAREWLVGHGAAESLLESLDEPSARRAFVAYLNLAHLHAAHVLSTRPLGEATDPTAIDPSGAPPAVARVMAASRFFGAGAGIETRDDVEAFLADAEAVADAYRRALAPQAYATPVYAANREAVAASERVVLTSRADRDSGYLEFGVAEGASVREVRRDGLLWYSVVREGGRPRIVTIAFSEE